VVGDNTVCNFQIATSEYWNDKNGQKQERTEWHRIAAWGKLGELCGEYLAKGRQVYVEGKIEGRGYEKDGVKKWSTSIRASSVQFLGGKPAGAPELASQARAHEEAQDEIPF
jgi:single-strand DNA-binding protein